MKKLIKIVILTAALIAVLAMPCFAEDSAEGTARSGLSGAVGGVLQWMLDNPAAVFSTIVSGVSSGFCISGGVSNRKTRKEFNGKSKELTKASTTINNNAVELAGKVKDEIVGMVRKVTEEVGNAVKAICNKVDELINTVRENIAETKAMRRELRAVSFQIGELVKDSRMTHIRKEEIAKGTEDILRGGEEVNDDSDQT